MAGLGSIALAAFTVLYTFDQVVTGGSGTAAPPDGLLRYFFFDQDHITDATAALGGLVAGVLGIVISVVSIVVQLSAERYTGVTAMFFRDRTNLGVMGFYVVACVCGVWVGLSVRDDFVPRVTLVAMMATTTVCLLLMAPYFAYVFRFLQPDNIIARIRREAIEVARRGASARAKAACEAAQAGVLSAMEELSDITSNSISGKDKIIASRAVDALKDFAIAYLRGIKEGASERWFEIGESIRQNPDFVAMDPESLADLVQRRTWVEWKVLRQFLGIYNEALASMRDINYLVAIDTRYIGEAAEQAKQPEVVALVFRYLNSFLRATLNARDVRTAYNVLNQYRLLVEALLRAGNRQAAVQAVGYLKYYAHVSLDMKLPFVTETVAYDVGALCQLAHEQGAPEEEAILGCFLELDRPSPERGADQGLKGVRKAQAKLAAYYLQAGERARAARIREDMAGEPRERLRAIRDELESVTTKDFWEIIDRGRNFEYMPPPQKAAMRAFFDELERTAVSSPPKPRSAPPPG